MRPELDWPVVVLLVACVVPANGYLLIYWQRPWRSTQAGRALMTKAVANAGLVDLGLIAEVFGRDHHWFAVLRAVVFAIFGTGMWLLFIALLRIPKPERSSKERNPSL